MVCFLIVGTPFFERAYFTFRFSRDTSIATKKDAWMMKYSLLTPSENAIDCSISLFRPLGGDDPNTIHHTVDMSIDSNIRHIIENREDDFRGLDTNSRKCLKEREIIRDHSLVFIRKVYFGFFGIV